MEKNIEENKKFGVNIISEDEDNKIVWFSLVIFILALIAIAFFIFKYYERYQLVQGINEPNQEQSEEGYSDIQKKLPTEMKGKIYLTLAPKNGESNQIGVYSYNLKKEILEEAVINKGLQLWGGEISPSGNRMLTTNMTTVYINDMANLTTWGKITDDDIYNFKSEPVWSIRGWYTIYSTKKDISLDPNIPENWQIYSVDHELNEKYLSDGIHPHVAKNNHIFFLKNDGLYWMDLLGGDIAKIWEIIGGARSNIQLDVSKIGDIGVLSNPNEGSLLIFRNNAENYAFIGEIVQEIKTYALQPTFSYDDKYLAVVELEKDSQGLLINPKLVVYDLGTYQKYEIMDLKDYKQEQMWINDWR